MLKGYPFIYENSPIPHNRFSTANRRVISQWKNCSREDMRELGELFLNNFSVGKWLWDSQLKICCEG